MHTALVMPRCVLAALAPAGLPSLGTAPSDTRGLYPGEFAALADWAPPEDSARSTSFPAVPQGLEPRLAHSEGPLGPHPAEAPGSGPLSPQGGLGPGAQAVWPQLQALDRLGGGGRRQALRKLLERPRERPFG